MRIRKSKDRQHNGQKKKNKRTNIDLQDITQKTKDRATPNLGWTAVLRKSKQFLLHMWNMSCYSYIATNPVLSHEQRKERLRDKDKKMDSLEEKLNDADRRSVDALKLGNHNEQYSRKHNIRMLNFPERKDENLREDFVKLVNTELKVHISPSDVQAIHRIPGKDRGIRPVIVKVKNTEVKINIMRKKRNLKKDFRFHDDITQSNLGLMARLKRSERFENVWFYNCNVYAKLAEGSRIKFDIFDNIEEKLRKKR